MNKQTIRNESLSIGAGVGTYYLSKELGLLSRKAIFLPIKVKVPENRIQPLKNSIDELIKSENFSQKQIKIVDASTPEYIESFQKGHRIKLFSLKRNIVSTKNPIKKLILLNKHRIQNKNHKAWLKMLEEGTNGYYTNAIGNKQIVANMKKGAHLFFHEAGHAIDYLNPYIERLFNGNKNKHLVRLPIFAALITALTTPENKQNKNFFDKIDSFIKKHCGILATLGFLPMMACETSANFRGQILAKKYAPSDLKLITKTHLYSLASYWTLPLIAGISVWTANKVKEKVFQKLKTSDPKTLKS